MTTITQETSTYKNDKVVVTYHPKREYEKAYIYIRDLTDPWNDPSGYTRKVRGIEKAHDYIKMMFESDLADGIGFSLVREVLERKFNLDVHTYCAVD